MNKMNETKEMNKMNETKEMNKNNIKEIARLEIILDVVTAALNRAWSESNQTQTPNIINEDKCFIINKTGGTV
jgi:hypothetical protein